MKIAMWVNNRQTYEARSVTVTYRNVMGVRRALPHAPCGCAVPVGFVLNNDGNYEREEAYLARHGLEYFRRQAAE